MLNKKKLKAMIELAIYEQKEGREDLAISKYYLRDYITFGILKNILLITVAYIAVLFFVFISNFENIAAEISNMRMQPMLVGILVFYLVLIALFSVVVIVVRKIKYRNAVNRVKKYYKKLRELEGLYKDEAQLEGNIKENQK